MRVVSWNVNGIRACVRHGFVDFVDRSGSVCRGAMPCVHLLRASPVSTRIDPTSRTSSIFSCVAFSCETRWRDQSVVRSSQF